MDKIFKIPADLSRVNDYKSLLDLIVSITSDVGVYYETLKNSDIPSIGRLKLDNITTRNTNRNHEIVKVKIEILEKTLSSLSVLAKYSEELLTIFNLPPEHYKGHDCKSKLGLNRYLDILNHNCHHVIVSLIERSLNDVSTKIDSLDSGLNSPYDFSSIASELSKSLENKLDNQKTIQVESLLNLAKNELSITQQAEALNEAQRTVITIYYEKLDHYAIDLSAISKELLSGKMKLKAKKLRVIVDGIRLVIKDTYEMVSVVKSVDWINESDDIFNTINDKGIDAFSDVIDYMETIKKQWIEEKTYNETQTVTRLAALRKLNVYMKQIKKLSTIGSYLEPDWVILGIKNITTGFNRVHHYSSCIVSRAYYLSHKSLPKPTVDVPDGFIRTDEIYTELTNSHGLLIVLVHLMKYFNYLNSQTWNSFQQRKPLNVCYDCLEIVDIIKYSICSFLDENELHSMSLDLADRLNLAKIKINDDRDALEYRLFRFKPTEPFKFKELQRKLSLFTKGNHAKYFDHYKLRRYIEENIDELMNHFNRKITNHSQLIIAQRAMDIMKRSFRTLNLMRSSLMYLNKQDLEYAYQLMNNQAANEFCYAIETGVKLLDYFRPNRRVPFSFSTSGQFTDAIEQVGLEVKKDFELKVETTINQLKEKITTNEADLEPIKDEKTQLRYLASILKRSKAIPIKDLDITEQDEIFILKEIIEEYEYTMMTYGPVN